MILQLLHRMTIKNQGSTISFTPTSSRECILLTLESPRKFTSGELVDCCRAMGHPISYHDLLVLLHDMERDGEVKADWVGESLLKHKVVSKL